jgi:DNA-3-methyladenine glycosylase I
VGRARHGDRALYERFSLEAFQSGLSWITILRKREGFRAAFAGFDPVAVAGSDQRTSSGCSPTPASCATGRRSTRPSRTPGRRSTSRGRARRSRVVPRPISPAASGAVADVPAVTPESTALAKALKRCGFRFVGPTTAYAAMQACGLVDDHLEGCIAPLPSGA